MTVNSWILAPAVALCLMGTPALALSAVVEQDKASEAQQPPIQARPGTPEGTPRTDQTVDVVKGTRLVVTNNAGEIVVTTWDRSAVRVQANHSTREKIDIQTADSVLRIQSTRATDPERGTRRGPAGLVDYRITVPSWMPVNLSGTYLEAEVSGTAAEVTVETVGGNIRISGGSSAVSARSVEGQITVEKTTGRVQATSVNQGVRLANTQGEVIVDTTNGDIVVDNAQTSNLEISTVNGDVTFNGTVRQNGVYKLTTHSGDIRVGLGGAANAIVFVRTFQGDFSADFPIQLPEGQTPRSGSKRFNFTLGAGSARIELQSFNGDIHLARTTVVSQDEERERRRSLVKPPTPPTPPSPPSAPKPPKPPGVGVDINIDVDAIVDMAHAAAAHAVAAIDKVQLDIDTKQMKRDLKAMTKDLGKLDFDFEHDIQIDVEDLVDDVLDELEQLPQLLPLPAVPNVPAMPTRPRP